MRTHPFHKEFEQLPVYSPPAQYIKSSGAQKKYCPLPGKLTCSTQYTYLFIMMKLILSLTLIWALSSTAGALQCQTCTALNCPSTVLLPCTTGNRCATTTTQATVSGTTVTQISKGCVLASLCPNTSSEALSANLGFGSTVISAKCCNTDNCNSETLAIPAQTDNNLQCFTCNGTNCSTKLQCVGTQDRCFKANFTFGSITTPLFGCVSKSVCDTVTNVENLPVIQNVGGNFTSRPSCCSSNLCNDACCFRLGVPHLLLGLLIFTLY